MKLVKNGEQPEIPVPFFSVKRRFRREPRQQKDSEKEGNNNNKKKGNKVMFVSFSNNTCIYMHLKHLSLKGSYIIALVPDILCSFALTLYKPITLLDRHLLLVPMKCEKKNSPLS